MRRGTIIALGVLFILTGCGQVSNSPETNSGLNSTAQEQSNTTTSNNTTSDNTTTSTPAGAVTNEADARAIITSLYKDKASQDPNLRYAVDHTDTDGSHKVYVVQVFDQMSDHTSTLAWINVRDDGLLRNLNSTGNWLTPDQYKSQMQ